MQLQRQISDGGGIPAKADSVDFSKLWAVVYGNWKLFFIIVATITLSATLISIFLPKTFKASAVIMPIGGKSGGSGGLAALAGQLSGMPSLAGLSGANSPTQQFMSLLKTRTLAEVVINENNLLPALLKKLSDDPALNMERGVKVLRTEHITFTEDKKGGIITIDAVFQDPRLAADVANGYVAGLQQFIKGNALTVAKRNRIFIEKQLAENDSDLLQAGKEINEFYKGGKVSNIDAFIDVPLNSFLSAGEQKIAPDDIFSIDKFETILKKKRDVEEQLGALKVVKNVPQQVYLQYLALKKTILVQVNGLLTQQYEMAKIEESKEELAFQLIDPAIPPTMRYSPKRGQIVMTSFFSSFFLALAAIFFAESKKKSCSSDLSSRSLQSK